MGSKKLKRKKFRNKRPEKFSKLKVEKLKKSVLSESLKERDREGTFFEKNSGDHLNLKSCSRPNIGEKCVSDVKYFAKVRENYFRYLQSIVYNNCVLFDSFVTKEMLENLTLELEQNALLACLQVEVYRKSMLQIIKAINKSTEEKQIHKDVKKLLSDLSHEKIHQTDTPETTALSLEVGTCRRTEHNLEANNFCTEQSADNVELYYSATNNCKEAYLECQSNFQINSNIESWCENEISLINQSVNSTNESSQTCNDLKISSNVIASHSSILQNNFNDLSAQNTVISSCISFQTEEKHKIDHLSLSRNQLQKLVEQTLNETEQVNRQKQDEQERACIAQILEGDDSFDERLNDSLSDNENEYKENMQESDLMDRLEKLRELFGMEDGKSQTEIVPEKPKESYKNNQVNIRGRHPSFWRYEKFIQLHKYSIIAGEMTLERRQINQKLFLQLFGEDSDEEHEMEFSSTEKYRSSCTERISSWVVKYLMPFYHDKRILGRNVFKSLGHYISDTIVDEIQYPDEWTVKYFVSKFFPPKKKYACNEDILNFKLN